MTEHILKTHEIPLLEIVVGNKTFEVRKNDRDYKAGDKLKLRAVDKSNGQYTGKEALVRVGYMLKGGQYGIEPGHVVMAIKLLSHNYDLG